jgi:hypothetical protein
MFLQLSWRSTANRRKSFGELRTVFSCHFAFLQRLPVKTNGLQQRQIGYQHGKESVHLLIEKAI